MKLVIQMSRTKGSKNKSPSRRDITKVSIETVELMFGYIQKHIRSEDLTTEQYREISTILEQMETVLQSGSKHLDRGYNL